VRERERDTNEREESRVNKERTKEQGNGEEQREKRNRRRKREERRPDWQSLARISPTNKMRESVCERERVCV